ncbi:MAG: O-antigen ligase family protein [Lachnospiraceae bacterium]|nr:O-antigen ligase family protein [Lachnospiraceae bacterium]
MSSAYPYVDFIGAVLLCLLLILRARQDGSLVICMGPSSVAGLVFPASGLIAVFCGIDKGLAFFGFARLLCAGIFVILLMQLSETGKERLFDLLVIAVASSALICALMYPFPGARQLVFNSGRLGGFMQYSNTYALLLLIAYGLFFLRKSETRYVGKLWLTIPLILSFGILWTGSRSVFVLFLLLNLYFVITLKPERKRLLTVLGLVFAVALLCAFLLQERTGIGRFLTISLRESTLIGRLLYWKDALPCLYKYPFGLGYMGYYSLQPLLQTGVYVTRFVHNSYLQIAMDHGVLALGAFVFLLWRAFFHGDRRYRSLVVMMGLHFFFDFDTAFYSMVFVLLLFADWKGDLGAGRKARVKALPVSLFACVAMLLFLWLGAADYLYETEKYVLADKIYPGCSAVMEGVMLGEKDLDKAAQMAEKIVAKNSYSGEAFKVLAYHYAGEEDCGKLMESLDRYIALNKYDMQAYSEMIVLLDEETQRLAAKGDLSSAEQCRQKILSFPEKVRQVREETSSLAYQIKDKPSFEVPEQIAKIILSYR